ncbi:MAG TPA: sodium/proton-translocating pyrophosphatase [Polyangiaceae bacterium]|nr:sodium/proton-translocating pyrophosphatase [Polyangiaceae bacterium]
MTELLLILGIQAAGLAYALVVGRAFAATEATSLRLRRLGSALERATSGLLGRGVRVTALAALATSALMFSLHLYFQLPGAHLRGVPIAFSCALAVLLGALLACVSTHAALRTSVRASLRIAGAARASMDRALLLAIRAGGSVSLIAEASSLLGLLGLFGVAFALAGGTTLAEPAALKLVRELVPALAGFPLGAAVASLVVQRAGGTYHAASELGGAWTGEREGGLEQHDPRNPALVGDLAGNHLGRSATRAALLFTTASAAHVAVLALALAAAATEPAAPLTWIFLPFVVRAFFLLASAFAMGAVRTEEMTSPSAAILRGQATATLVGLSGVCGAALWLAPDHWGALLGAGALGCLLAWLVGLPGWLRLTARGGRGAREADDSFPTTGAPAALANLGKGLESVVLPTVAVGVTASFIWYLGTRTGLPSGGVWAALVGWTALLGTAAFAHAACAVATLAQGANGIGPLAALDAEARRRTSRLEEASVVSASGHAQLVTVAVATGLLCALAIPTLSGTHMRLQFGMLDPSVTWSGALGAALVLAYAGSCLRAAVSGAREVAGEVERQLRAFPRERGVFKVPPSFSPSYKACVDLCSRVAVRGLPFQVSVAVFVPMWWVLTVRFALRGESALSSQALVSFVLASAVTGFAAMLAIDAARASLLDSRRMGRTSGAGDSSARGTTHAVADALSNCAAPAAHALVLTLAAIGLALAPFMI